MKKLDAMTTAAAALSAPWDDLVHARVRAQVCTPEAVRPKMPDARPSAERKAVVWIAAVTTIAAVAVGTIVATGGARLTPTPPGSAGQMLADLPAQVDRVTGTARSAAPATQPMPASPARERGISDESPARNDDAAPSPARPKKTRPKSRAPKNAPAKNAPSKNVPVLDPLSAAAAARRAGDVVEALAHLDRADIGTASKRATVQFWRGRLLMDLHRPKEALRAFESCIRQRRGHRNDARAAAADAAALAHEPVVAREHAALYLDDEPEGVHAARMRVLLTDP